MEPKKVDKGKQVAESSRPCERGNTHLSNPHKIIFKDESQGQRYSTLVKWRILSRYICETTVTTLGLKLEIDRMFHSNGLLEFMQNEAPTFERITLEFLSTFDFKLKRKYINGTRYYYGTIKFRLFRF